MAKSPVPVGSSTPHSTGYNSDGTVDQVLKAITALSVGIEKQNSALEDHFGKLSKHLDDLNAAQISFFKHVMAMVSKKMHLLQ